MARKIAATKKSSGVDKKGGPSKPGHPKAGFKDPHLSDLDAEEEIAEKYLENEDEDVPGNNVLINNPNRGYNKPNIDKPSYN